MKLALVSLVLLPLASRAFVLQRTSHKPSVALHYQDEETGSQTSNQSDRIDTYSLNCGAPGARRPLRMTASMTVDPVHGAVESPVHNFLSPKQYLQALDDNFNDDELLVVKYHASYCKICQRAGISFKKIAIDRQDQPVRFARLESSRLPADLLRELGLTKFPFVQIFRHGKIVASFSTGPSHMFTPKVRNTVDSCLARTNEEWTAIEDEFAHEMDKNLQARELLREYCNTL